MHNFVLFNFNWAAVWLEDSGVASGGHASRDAGLEGASVHFLHSF